MRRKRSPTLYQLIVDAFCNKIEWFFKLLQRENKIYFLSGTFEPVEEGDLVKDIPVHGNLPVIESFQSSFGYSQQRYLREFRADLLEW